MIKKLQLFISPEGDDRNSGGENDPLQTLEGARDYIRKLKHSRGLIEQITVYLRGGQYVRQSSFELTDQDSGTNDMPIIYKAYPGEVVSITGGRILDTSEFRPITDHDILERLSEGVKSKVVVCDLKAQGITTYGEIPKQGFNWEVQTPAPELFIDTQAMSLARYPRTGFLSVQEVVQEGFVPRDHMPDKKEENGEVNSIPKSSWLNQPGPIFKYNSKNYKVIDEERKQRWSKESEIWLSGYWKFDWADDHLKVKIDGEAETFIAEHPSFYGINKQGEQGGRYYAYNLLCEIDRPGEWYLDRTSGKIYLYPPKKLQDSQVELSILKDPLVTMTGAEYVRFEDITFEISRGNGVQMRNCQNNLIAGCTFRKLGQIAVAIGNEIKAFDGTILVDSEAEGGRNNGIVSCDIYEIGAKGISIIGGNRDTLEPAKNYAYNNHIYNYARLIRTYQPAISLSGVGNSAQNNLIHDAPHMAIQFSGNEHLIAYNEIYNVCKETQDAGVIYSVRDWTYRGNKINHNFIHDIETMSGLGSYVMYFDDMMSSADVTYNVFYNIANTSILVGGGRDHHIHHNMFINSRSIIHMDNRGQNWGAPSAEAPNGTCYRALQNTPYTKEIWRNNYPKLTTIWPEDNQEEAKIPRGNIFKNNISYKSGRCHIVDIAKETGDIENPIVIEENEHISFVDEKNLNLELKDDSVVFEKIPNFKKIEFSQIGLYEDNYRKV